LNAAAFGPPFIQNAAECRDLDGQVGILDHRPAPDGGHDLFFCDQITRPFNQHAENIEGAQADRDRNKNAAFIAPGQPLAPPIEAEVLEQENVGRGEHAEASPCSRESPFARDSGCVLGSILQRLGTICSNFGNFLDRLCSPISRGARLNGCLSR
jgi:hypothetical protein